MAQRDHWYLAFIGTQTIPMRARSMHAVRRKVLDDYAGRGIHLRPAELRVRRATPNDAGWLKDMGAPESILLALRAQAEAAQ